MLPIKMFMFTFSSAWLEQNSRVVNWWVLQWPQLHDDDVPYESFLHYTRCGETPIVKCNFTRWRHHTAMLSSIMALCDKNQLGLLWRAILYPLLLAWTGSWTHWLIAVELRHHDDHLTPVHLKLQWNLSVTTTSIIKFITCDLFRKVF